MARSRYKMTADKMEKREDQKGGFYDSIFKSDVQVYKVRKGINTVRFLPMYGATPSWQTDEHFGMDVWLHRNVGPDSGTYLCLRKHLSEPCPVCEERQELDATDNSEAAKEILARKSVVYWIIDRDDEDKGPQLHMWGYTLDQDLTQRCKDRQTGQMIDILAEEDGYDVSFRRGDEKPYPKTTGMEIARRDSPICDDQKLQDEWVAQVRDDHPLEGDLLNYYDYDYIHNILHARGSRKRDEGNDRDSRSTSRDDERGRDRDERSTRSRRDPPDETPPPRERTRREPDDERDRDRGDRDRDRSTRDEDPPPRSQRDRDEEPPPRSRRDRDDDNRDNDRDRDRGRDREPADAPPRRAERDRDRDNGRDRGGEQGGRDAPEKEEPPRARRRERLPDDDEKDGKERSPTDQARESLQGLRDEQDERNPPRREEGNGDARRSRDKEDDPPPRSRRDRDEDPPPRSRRDRDEEPPPRSRRPT